MKNNIKTFIENFTVISMIVTFFMVILLPITIVLTFLGISQPMMILLSILLIINLFMTKLILIYLKIN